MRWGQTGTDIKRPTSVLDWRARDSIEPTERVKELGDASVPFNFDVHALFFADDAVEIGNQMHDRVADRPVNLVNQRREFEIPGAVEFHQSQEASRPAVEAQGT